MPDIKTTKKSPAVHDFNPENAPFLTAADPPVNFFTADQKKTEISGRLADKLQKTGSSPVRVLIMRKHTLLKWLTYKMVN